MNFFRKTDDVINSVAVALAGSGHRRPMKFALYVLLFGILFGIPYSLVHHVQTSGFHVVSVEREEKVGDEVAARIGADMRLLPAEDAVSLYIGELGHKVAVQNNPWEADFRFHVVDDPRMANAFAIPGGRIYVTTGLLRTLDNEAELAAVLAHEVAHVSCRHYARNLGRQMLMSWVKKFLGSTDRTMLEAGSFLTTNIAFLRMRQEDELEADFKGALYIYDLDYDLTASVSLAQKLLDMERRMPDFIRVMAVTHPPSRERLEAMVELRRTFPKKEEATLGESVYNENVKSKLPDPAAASRSPGFPF